MKIQKIIWLIFSLVLIFAFFSGNAYAKVQRMGIPKGTYSLAPKQSRQVKAFCLDHDRPAPGSGHVLGHVLSSSSEAVVNVGGEIIPLQKAIEDEIISIGGRNMDASSLPPLPTSTELLQKLRTELLRDSTLESQFMLRELDSLSDTEKQQLAEQFLVHAKMEQAILLGSIQSRPDFRHVNFVNKTDKAISIEFRENGIVGSSVEDVSDLPIQLLDPSSVTTREGQALMQDRLWLATQQTKLHEIGIASGRIDGIMDDATDTAIRQFEKIMDLEPTGEWKNSSKLLNEVASAKEIFAGRSPPATAIKSLPSPPPAFVVFRSDGSIRGAKDRIQLADVAFNTRDSKSHQAIIMDGFTEGDAIAFSTTVRVRDIANNPRSTRRIIGITDKRATSKVRIYEDGSGNWVAEMPIDVNSTERRTIKIVTNLKETTLQLLQLVAQLFNREPDLLSLPVEKMVLEMRKKLPNGKGIGVKDEELGRFYLVDLDWAIKSLTISELT